MLLPARSCVADDDGFAGEISFNSASSRTSLSRSRGRSGTRACPDRRDRSARRGLRQPLRTQSRRRDSIRSLCRSDSPSSDSMSSSASSNAPSKRPLVVFPYPGRVHLETGRRRAGRRICFEAFTRRLLCEQFTSAEMEDGSRTGATSSGDPRRCASAIARSVARTGPRRTSR